MRRIVITTTSMNKLYSLHFLCIGYILEFTAIDFVLGPNTVDSTNNMPLKTCTRAISPAGPVTQSRRTDVTAPANSEEQGPTRLI